MHTHMHSHTHTFIHGQHAWAHTDTGRYSYTHACTYEYMHMCGHTHGGQEWTRGKTGQRYSE